MSSLKFTLPDVTWFLPDNLPGLKFFFFKPTEYSIGRSFKNIPATQVLFTPIVFEILLFEDTAEHTAQQDTKRKRTKDEKWMDTKL